MSKKWSIFDSLRKKMQSGTVFMGDGLRIEMSEEWMDLDGTLADFERKVREAVQAKVHIDEELQARIRRGTVRNGFVGPIPTVYGWVESMGPEHYIDLDPKEWRRE